VRAEYRKSELLTGAEGSAIDVSQILNVRYAPVRSVDRPSVIEIIPMLSILRDFRFASPKISPE
jgi:hypothetical protein